ncbi:MAG: phosphoglucosamine mutase, partial [Actinomycetota bacterium]|nr:phosphoglucosamine mutase [Actinomycetota bacterium]
MPLRFGTDGIRGVANGDLTPELALALGRAAVRVLGDGPFVVGRDTRRSGSMLQAAFSAGAASEGADVVDLGVLPTPGVAFVGAVRRVPGAVVSASHNPFPDNGVKLFAAGGRKLSDAEEADLESELEVVVAGDGGRPTGTGVGALVADPGASDGYVDHLVGALEGRSLEGLSVVLDCGHGAAWAVAPEVVRAAGARVAAVMGAAPDGTNINAGCGSTDLRPLQAAVAEHGADVGLAFDGDADRVLAVDGAGGVVDGDHILALCALDLQRRGRLRGGTVVVTVMTNLGFRRAMEAAGIAVHETPVGDRHVLAALDGGGWSLGGEQSGHLVFRDLATTGDGILTGVQLLDLVARRGRPLAELAGEAMTRLPQVLHNVRVAQAGGDVGA